MVSLSGPVLLENTGARFVCFLQVRKAILKEVASQLRPELEAIVAAQDAQLQGEYSPDFKSAARRYADLCC
jgi:hypothetical protein